MTLHQKLYLLDHFLVIQLKKLELGVDIKFKDVNKEIKFFLFAAVMDKPAKAALLNMINSSGFYGCTKCLQPGISFKQNEKSKLNFVIKNKEILFFLNFSMWSTTYISI